MLDFILCTLYSIIGIGVCLAIIKLNPNKNYKYLLSGLLLKILGGIAFYAVYVYIFNYVGDTFRYLRFGGNLANLIIEDFNTGIQVFLSKGGEINDVTRNFARNNFFFNNEEEFMVVRFAAITSFFTGNGISIFSTRYSTTILFSLLSYIGIWNFYTFFNRLLPEANRVNLFTTILLPSFIFWGSGVMKDTLVIAFLGIFLNKLYKIFYLNKLNVIDVIFLLFSLFIFTTIKAYVTFALIPSIFIIWVWKNKNKIKNPAIKFLIFPFFLTFGIFGISASILYLGSSFERFSPENVIDEANKFQEWHYGDGDFNKDLGRGSSYTLGDYDPTPTGLLLKFIPAVNVALFRPYVWEVKNAQMLIAGFESLILLLIFLYTLIKVNFKNILHLLNKNPILVGMVLFVLIFSFAVGFTSYNFGALSRYRIPMLPFFVFILIYLIKSNSKLQNARSPLSKNKPYRRF